MWPSLRVAPTKHFHWGWGCGASLKYYSMQKLIHVETNPNINPFDVRKKLAANQESDRPFLTVVVV